MAKVQRKNPETILKSGTLFRSVAKTGKVWGSGFTAKVIYSTVRKAASDCGFGPVSSRPPQDLCPPVSSGGRGAGKYSSCSGMCPSKRRGDILAASSAWKCGE